MIPKLNGKSLEEILELNLTSCKLTDFDDVFNILYFPKLIELNLTSNYFSSMRMIGNLPFLKILVLNSNKIETLYCDPNSKIGLNGCQVN